MKNIFFILLSALLIFGQGCRKRTDDKPVATKKENSESATTETPTPLENPVVEVPDETPVATSGKSGVLIHVMEGQEAYKFLLALDMAEKMAADHEVMVYFDHLAVNAVLKDAKDVQYSPFTPMREQLAKLQSLGVKLRACAPCVQASWKKAEDMSAGVKMFEAAELSALGGGNVMTFSY